LFIELHNVYLKFQGLVLFFSNSAVREVLRDVLSTILRLVTVLQSSFLYNQPMLWVLSLMESILKKLCLYLRYVYCLRNKESVSQCGITGYFESKWFLEGNFYI